MTKLGPTRSRPRRGTWQRALAFHAATKRVRRRLADARLQKVTRRKPFSVETLARNFLCTFRADTSFRLGSILFALEVPDAPIERLDMPVHR